MKLTELIQQTGVILLTPINEEDGRSVFKLGVGTLYVWWVYLYGKYQIRYITGDPQGNEKLTNDPELEQWVLNQLYQKQPAKAA